MKAFKGNIVYTENKNEFRIYNHGYVIVEDGKVIEVTKEQPNVERIDFGDKLILPGFVDVHIHAPQFPNRGIGYDEQLLPWLERYTFPTEAGYSDTDYAKKEYKWFINALWKYGTLRSVVYSTYHKEATELLFELFKKSGLSAFIGKVNMDRNAVPALTERTEDSLADTRYLIEKYKEEKKVKPIITPRFAPSCSDELMEGLSQIIEEYDVPVQSHLSENKAEIAWVKKLHPDSKNYASVYQKYNMLGKRMTLMAHCVYCTEEEKKALKENGVVVAHCPTSNLNLMSGLAPIRDLLNRGVRVALGSDVAGGHTVSMMQTAIAAMQVSKMYRVHINEKDMPLTLSEVFYMATKSGGGVFGKVGSFEPGYSFDALVIDDESLGDCRERSIEERVARFFFLGDDRQIVHRFVEGEEITLPFAEK